MPEAILYCDHCTRMISAADVKSGEAVVTPVGAFCAACVGALEPGEKEALKKLAAGEPADTSLSSVFRRPKPSPARRPPTGKTMLPPAARRQRAHTTTLRAARAEPQAKSRAGAMALAGLALGLVAGALVLMLRAPGSSRNRKPPPKTNRRPATDTAPEEGRRTGAKTPVVRSPITGRPIGSPGGTPLYRPAGVAGGRRAGSVTARNGLAHQVFKQGDVWRYFKGTSFPGAGWNGLGFDDSSWPSGPTGIGYGDNDDATVLSDMRNGYLTVYMRREFTMGRAAAATSVSFSVDYDDGFVAFINGTEVARRNVAAGQDHNTGAPFREAGKPEVIDLTAHKGSLVDGTNVFAIELHNYMITSSDALMIPELSIEGGDPGIRVTNIVDNADATGVEITGAWPSSTYDTGYYAADYLHDDNAGKGTKSVRFTPDLAEARTYNVYLRWISSVSRATNVPVDVVHAGGTATVTVNQQEQGGEWVLLGTWTFNAGTAGSVLVRTDGTAGHVIADAVRFAVPLGTDDLVGHWRLDETGAETVAADSSTYGNDGNLIGDPEWYAGGRIRGALDFDGYDGSQDCVQIPNSPSLENVNEGDYSLSAWACPDTVPTGVVPYDGYCILMKSGNNLGLYYDEYETFRMTHFSSASCRVSSGNTFAVGTFHHVVGVVSKTNGTVDLYVNGNLEGSNTFPPGDAAREYGPLPWRIGCAYPGTTIAWPMDGKIDDARIYDRALTAEEIGELYESTRGDAGVGAAGPEAPVEAAAEEAGAKAETAEPPAKEEAGATPTEEAPAPTPPPAKQGLLGEYYGNTTLVRAPVLTRIDPRIDFNWGTRSPDPKLPEDRFSCRWTGAIRPEFSETYTFHVYRNDGVRLWIGGDLLIDRWRVGYGEHSARKTLEAGVNYPIRIEHYDRIGPARVSLGWQSDSQPREIVPQSALSPPADGSRDTPSP